MSAPRIRIMRHEAVSQSGSFEVRFADGRESKFFYFDDVLARRLRPELFTSEDALEQARHLLGPSGTRTAPRHDENRNRASRRYGRQRGSNRR